MIKLKAEDTGVEISTTAKKLSDLTVEVVRVIDALVTFTSASSGLPLEMVREVILGSIEDLWEQKKEEEENE